MMLVFFFFSLSVFRNLVLFSQEVPDTSSNTICECLTTFHTFLLKKNTYVSTREFFPYEIMYIFITYKVSYLKYKEKNKYFNFLFVFVLFFK
jgi:hypothetical protein